MLVTEAINKDFLYFNYRQFCLELNGLAVKLQVSVLIIMFSLLALVSAGFVFDASAKVLRLALRSLGVCVYNDFTLRLSSCLNRVSVTLTHVPR